jgi:PPM family protein phosphatase
VALHIVESAALTDVGRQRSANEDKFVQEPPFFAVADGMGGAKAGEVASQLAADAFTEEAPSSEGPEGRLRGIARVANKRIYELAQRDESRRGMGTTLTAALVDDDQVSFGHVGDSRAYLLRDGRLEQLTRDHSLVAELERSGQLSPEAAEQHPQRSIITRALGPEPDVNVDTYTVGARPGDVFLICSDGLTSMVSDDEVASILRGADSLEAAAEALIRAANQSGGKDNITAVLFRLGEEAGNGAAEAATAADETIAGGLHADEVQAAAPTQPGAPAPPPTREAPPAPPPAARGRGRRRRVVAALISLLVVAGVGGGLYVAGRHAYFVGTDDAGLIALYRGLPYDLPLGVELYSERYTSSVPATEVPSARRKRVLDHELRSRADAEDLIRQLERGNIEGLR